MPTGTSPPPGPWARAIAEVIGILAEDAQVSRAVLCERAGLSPSTLSRCIAGRRSLTLDETARLAAALGLTPTHIVQRGVIRLGGPDLLSTL